MSEVAPLVSVCIPTFRGAAYVRETIDSVLTQRFTDFELIIVDDASPDDTVAIIRSFNDARIRLYQQPSRVGAQRNWNDCLGHARGRYVKLLPQDDVLAPDCLVTQVAQLDADTAERLALVFSSRRIVDTSGQALTVQGYPGKPGVIAAHRLVRRSLRRGANLIGEPGGVLFRSALAKKVGPFSDENPYVIDFDYWLKLLAHGDAHYSAEPLVSFRVSPNQWSVALGPRQGSDFRALARRIGREPRWGTNAIDHLAAVGMSELRRWARMAVYAWVARRSS